MKKFLLPGLAAALTTTAVPAVAAPVTVHVRVEGPTSTLVDRDVTADVRTWHFSSGADTSDHECNGTASTGGSSGTPVTVSNNALLTALDQLALPVTGAWYDGLGPSISTIGGVALSESSPPYRYLVEYKNLIGQDLGGCSTPLNNGDEVLYGFAEYGSKALGLTGPATLAPGATGTATVTDGTAAVAGATVGSATTGADGKATIGPFSTRGEQPAIKATKDGFVRSRGLVVCVTDGADGFCGTTKPGQPAPTSSTPAATTPALPPDTTAKVTAVKEQQRFTRAKAPRSLGGSVTVGAKGLKQVEIRLTRSNGARCEGYDGKREKFVTLKKFCADHGTYFTVGAKADWTYLLPAKLGKGRYVLDVRATDNSGDTDAPLQRGRNRIVFFVS